MKRGTEFAHWTNVATASDVFHMCYCYPLKVTYIEDFLPQHHNLINLCLHSKKKLHAELKSANWQEKKPFKKKGTKQSIL